MDRYRVLFVCTGNICRSPTAEGVLRQRAEAIGLEDRLEIDSAGTHGYHIGEPPDPRAIRQAGTRGYDLSDLRARRLRREDFTEFDLLVAMDRGHLSVLERLAPEKGGAKRCLLLDYAPEAHHRREVPDPYYGDHRDYDHALDLIEVGVEGLLQALARELK